MIKLAVIADDLTGANDTAVQFAKHDIRTCVKIDFDQREMEREDHDVVVVDTDSRDIPADMARQKVKATCALLQKSHTANIYKKIDSTLRGNLGAEIEVVAEVFAPEVIVIAPAFPQNKRITIGGYHLLDSVPIELTEIARAPKSPVRESRIVELLKTQTNAEIAWIPLHIVIRGQTAIQEAITACLNENKRWIVFDSASDKDLQEIVEAAKLYRKVLWVGSAGLATYLPHLYDWSTHLPQVCPAQKGKVLIVSGSVSKITQEQIAVILRSVDIGLVKMDIAAILQKEETEIERCVAAARRIVDDGHHVLLASSNEDTDMAAALAAGQIYGLIGAQVSERAAAALGAIVKRLSSVKWSGMVLTGGDTAIHVCRALEAGEIDIMEEVAVGIPLGKLCGGVCDGLRVITKAGAFGESDCFVRAIEAMQKEGEDK